jgi:hypothetical protein
LKADEDHILPGTETPLVSDKEGRERFHILVSRDELSFNWTRERGDGGEAINPVEFHSVTQTYRAENTTGAPLKVTAEVVIANKPPLLLRTDRETYAVGETITITMGSERPGFLYLFVDGPEQQWQPLGFVDVEKNGLREVELEARSPVGQYELLLVYRERKVDPRSIRVPLPEETPDRGLRVKQNPNEDRVSCFIQVE